MRVAVYGSLKKGLHNHMLLRNAELVGEDILRGWDMYSLGGFPGVKQGEGAICVEVYDVNEEELQDLDYLEGYYPDNPERGLYNRVRVSTSCGEAFLYTYNGEVAKHNQVVGGNWNG